MVRWTTIRRGARGLLAAALLLAMAAAAPAAPPPKADRILVIKKERILELLKGGAVLKTYPIALGRRPLGHKQRRGDGRTPEGIYAIDGRNDHSRFHRSLHVSYPDALDRLRAGALHRDPGDGIFIHGMPERAGKADPVRFFKDWTDGCVAVGNTAIEEIWDAVEDGTPIEIRP